MLDEVDKLPVIGVPDVPMRSRNDRTGRRIVARHPQLQVGVRANPRWVTDAPMRSQNDECSRPSNNRLDGYRCTDEVSKRTYDDGNAANRRVTDAPMRSQNAYFLFETHDLMHRYRCTHEVSKRNPVDCRSSNDTVTDAPMRSQNTGPELSNALTHLVTDAPMGSQNTDRSLRWESGQWLQMHP